MKQKKLETKDYIPMGIFSLIYTVIAFIIGGIAQMTPITFPFMPLIVALFTGTVFMLYVVKIPKRGSIIVLGIIAAIILFITGMFWTMSLFFIIFGIAADFICASGNFRSFKRNLIAYCVISLAPMGAYVPMVLMPKQFEEFINKKGGTVAFSEIIDIISTSAWVIPAMIIGTVICAIIGGFIGKKLLHKHFEKVGIV